MKPGITSRKGPDTTRQLQARADRASVLAVLRRGPATAAEIASVTGLTPRQVTRRLEELSDLGEAEARAGRWSVAPEARRA